MGKICVHVGLALFAIKVLCLSRDKCQDCPMEQWCNDIDTIMCPDKWNSNAFPNIVVVLELTDDNGYDTIELAPQIE